MNFAIVRFILGWVLEFEAGFLLLPLLVGFLYGEVRFSLCFAATAALCLLAGVLLKCKKPVKKDLYTREGFATVALSWIVMSAFGALPFLFSGEIPNYVDAVFEAASGFTTTGARRSATPVCSGAALPTGSAAWGCLCLSWPSCP